MQMQIPKSGFPLRSLLTALVIQVAATQAHHQPANPSIERDVQELPLLAAPHVKR